MTQINIIIWSVATFLLISSGLFYSFKLHFTQFNFKKMFQSLRQNNVDACGVSSFKTLTLALAARIGVGSLAGIALGLYKGGIGIVFWIWLSCLITLPNSFVESTLAVLYRDKKGKHYEGGPAYYINKGLKLKKLSIVYASIMALCYLGGFIAIQSNTIAASLFTYLNIPTIITGVIISLVSYFVISRGLNRITNFNAILVPIMGIVYMVVALLIIIANIKMIPNLLISIVREAFNFKSFGWGIISSVIIGVQRGIFSSEAGIGTGAVASGTSGTDKPISQGYLQMLGVYFTSFIICTSTAFIILTSSIDFTNFNDPNGIEIILRALNNHLGDFGTIFLIIAIIAFAFSTIISGYFYGESNLSFLDSKMNAKKKKLLNVFIMVILLYGAVARPSNLWNIVDIGVAILAIINIIAIFLLRKKIILEYQKERSKNYDRK